MIDTKTEAMIYKTHAITLGCILVILALVFFVLLISIISGHPRCDVSATMDGNVDATMILNELNVSLSNTTQLDGNIGGGFTVEYNGPCRLLEKAIREG